MTTTNISSQPSKELQTIIDNYETNAPNVSRSNSVNSESTFTRHTNKIHSIIKEIIMGVMCILQMWMIVKISK